MWVVNDERVLHCWKTDMILVLDTGTIKTQQNDEKQMKAEQ